jgi:hypothetical protein
MVGIVTASANSALPPLEPSSAPTLKAVAVIAFEKVTTAGETLSWLSSTLIMSAPPAV